MLVSAGVQFEARFESSSRSMQAQIIYDPSKDRLRRSRREKRKNKTVLGKYEFSLVDCIINLQESSVRRKSN